MKRLKIKTKRHVSAEKKKEYKRNKTFFYLLKRGRFLFSEKIPTLNKLSYHLNALHLISLQKMKKTNL